MGQAFGTKTRKKPLVVDAIGQVDKGNDPKMNEYPDLVKAGMQETPSFSMHITSTSAQCTYI